jgi:hypothetical protein
MIIRKNDVKKVNISVRQTVTTVFLIGGISDLTTKLQIYDTATDVKLTPVLKK